MKKFIITEKQYKVLVEQESDGECVIDLDYTKFGFMYDLVFVNGISDNIGERVRIFNEIKESDCKILLHNIITSETFELTKDDFQITKTDSKHIYISKDAFNKKIFPYFPDIVKFESFIKSANIKEALQIAFKDYWVPSGDTYVAGVVGVKPIKNDPRGWSIVNFFNSKDSVHEMMKMFLVRDIKNNTFIYDENDIESSVNNWMVDLFSNVNSSDMKILLDIQEKSIVDNFKQEKLDAEKIRDRFHPGSEIEYSGYGTIRDIIDGIDVTIGGVTYQIKPYSTISEDDKFYSVNIGFSNAVNYKYKPVNRIAFIKGKLVYVFNNNIKSLFKKTYKFDKKDLIRPQ